MYMENNDNNFQPSTSFLDNYNSNTNIYTNLIHSFESHLLSPNQINNFVSYMQNNCDINFTKDMTYVLEDFNSLLNQSIQAIKTLLTENIRLIQNQTLTALDNKENNTENNNVIMNDNANDEEESKNINNEIPLKKPLREQIKLMVQKRKNLQSTPFNQGEQPLNLSALKEEKKNEKDNNREDIDKLKVTNEILKQIEVTQKNMDYFVKKYNPKYKKNIPTGYKDFLQKIIEYQYDLHTLNEINQDIDGKLSSRKKIKKQEKETSHYLSSKKFCESLRNYTNNQTTNQPPFVPFTNPYGRLFSKDNLN